MQAQVSSFGRSSLVKVAGIGFLILVLIIPLAMTRDVISDRRSLSDAAKHEIMRSWGGRQVVGGPILVVPYIKVTIDPYVDRTEERGEVYFLPENLSYDADLRTEIRYRGIHEVPVYTANMRINGHFAPPDTSGLGLDGADFDWQRATIVLPVADARAIRNAPTISVGEAALPFEAGGMLVHGFAPQIVAHMNDVLGAEVRAADIEFDIDIDVAGTEVLQFLPLGNSTEVSVRSPWASPSFNGRYLPETREISDDGFAASWRLSSLGRALPARWTSHSPQQNTASAFGVDLFVPVGLYQLADRATKYGILFIGLTFVTFFLFEVLARMSLHPLHYLLVGFANVLFYLLLLSFSEHIGFGGSYLLSTLASTSLVTAYSSSILGNWQRASLVTAMLICLYGFLYLTLNAESYAMLAGSVGLWVTLALVMYLTRKIDWYRWGRSDNEIEQASLFDTN